MSEKDDAQQAEAARSSAVGVYKHYKGSFYTAYGTNVKEDTFEPLVHYFSQEKKTRWTRTRENFHQLVELQDPPRLVARFQFMRLASWPELLEAVGLDELLDKLKGLATSQASIDKMLL